MDEKKRDWTLDEIGRHYVSSLHLGKGKQFQGGDKTSLGKYFTKTYHELFLPLRDSNVRLLELGVLTGKSIAMWSDYFAKGEIVGVDIALDQVDHKTLGTLGAFQNKNVTWIQQDVRDAKGMEKKFRKSTKVAQYTIIIDDALHTTEQQWKNFNLLFPCLQGSGFYVIEDVVEPDGLLSHFLPLLTFLVNPKGTKLQSHQKKMAIRSISIQENLVIIRKEWQINTHAKLELAFLSSYLNRKK